MPSQLEKEKMLAGEFYNCLDPKLVSDREKAKALMQQFNLAQERAEQTALLAQMLGLLGSNAIIEPPFYCSYGCNIYIGTNVYLNFSCTILDNNQVHLGNDVMLGPMVQIYTAVHPLEPEARRQRLETALPVVIGENVWLGGGSIVLPGVTIGKNAVVGAGAVVTKDVPENTVVAGNPARILKTVGP